MNDIELIKIIEDAIDSMNVFFTPLERRRNWNEYKDDAQTRFKDAKDAINEMKRKLNNK